MTNLSRTEEIAKFLIAWCLLKGLKPKERVTDEMISLWEAATKDIPLPELHQSMNDYLRTATGKDYWPTPGDIRNRYDSSVGKLTVELAEIAWDKVEEILRKHHYDPDLGGFLGPIPEITEEMEYAVRIAGGWNRLRTLDNRSYDFVRRDFIESIKRHREKTDTRGFLTKGESEKFLSELNAKRRNGEIPF